jgi:hypothetical protein
VYYTFPQSLEEQSISKYAVAKLNEKSKHSFIVSEKIQLNGKSDYNKVVVLQNTKLRTERVWNITSFYLNKENLSFRKW